MDIKQIKTFTSVVEWGSFSKAANHLYLSQPTVSMHIKQLEDQLGIKLLERTTKSHLLTDQGQEFYKHVQPLLRLSRNIEKTFSQKQNNSITIGASSNVATYLLPEIIINYLLKYPLANVEIIQRDSIQVMNEIVGGILNYGVVGSKVMNNSVTFHKIYTDELVIATPYNEEFLELASSQFKLEELFKYPYITREEGSGTYKKSVEVLDSLGIDRRNLDQVIEVNNNEIIKEFIKRNFGFSLVSKLAIREEVKNQQILAIEIPSGKAYRDFYLVQRLNNRLPAIDSQFVEFIKGFDFDS